MKLLFTLLMLIPLISYSQKFKSDSSYVRFFSEAPLENIEAVNSKAVSIIDLSNGNFVFSIPVNQFHFDKSLMEEHFNENYLETEKYPKAIFKGSFKPSSLVDGAQTVTASGDFNIHGQTRPVNIEGTLTKSDNQVLVKATFTIKIVEYKIKIPKAVFYNIAEEVEVTVYFEYKEL